MHRPREQRVTMKESSPHNSIHPEKPILEVAAAVLWREGKLLVTQRPPGTHLAGLWEFPGGKMEPGETPAQCLVRELEEELGIQIHVSQLLHSTTYEYEDRIVRLYFLRCHLQHGEPQPIGCAQIRWVEPSELPRLPMPPADQDFVSRLLQGLCGAEPAGESKDK